MGRPPSNGGPSFRFNSAEVVEMESILQDHNNMMPAQELLVTLADKFSNSPERQGKFVVQTKQIWNWFQNKRYAIRARTTKIPTVSNVSSMQSVSTGVPMHSVAAPDPVVSTMPTVQAKPAIAPSAPVISKEDNLSSSRFPQSVTDTPGKTSADSSPMEFEARSARDGAWYDVASFLSIRNLEAGCPEVLVRFAGFGPEEDEWINVTTHVRHRSLPCESSECVAVLPGDLILCFQEGKEQALYFDAHVLDAQRRRHDARGCRCRFLVRYDHDQSEEIVPLRKICRRPETDYRLQQLHAMNESSAEQRKSASSVDLMKSASAEERNENVASVKEIEIDVDPSSSKAAFSNSVTLSEQKPPLTGIPDSTDKERVDINGASSNSQPSRPDIINLDPETEVENKSQDIKDTLADMDVDVPSEKATDMMLKCKVDATYKTCISSEKTDGMPVCGIDTAITQNVTGELVNQAPLVVETEHASNTAQAVAYNQAPLAVETEHAPNAGQIDPDNQAPPVVEPEHSLNAGQIDLDNQAPPVFGARHSWNDGQVDPEPIIVETNSTVDEGKTDIDHAKDVPISSTEPYLTQEAAIPLSSPPADARINEGKFDVPEMTSNVGDVTLKQNVLKMCGATTIDAGKTDIDIDYAKLSGDMDIADHPVDDSVPSISPTTNANAENRMVIDDEPMTQAEESIE